MKSVDKEAFSRVMYGLGEVFEAKMSMDKIDLYFHALKDLSIDQVRAAGGQLLKTYRFNGHLPKPVEFIEAALGDADSRATIAWEKVLKAMSRVGYDGSVVFDDPAIMTAIKLMGGWVAVCKSEGYENEKWLRMAFEKTYKAVADKNMEHPAYLPGRMEIENSATGWNVFIPKPAYIGEPEKRLEIEETLQKRQESQNAGAILIESVAAEKDLGGRMEKEIEVNASVAGEG